MQLVKVVTVPPNSHLQVFVQFRPELAAGASVDADGVEAKRIELGTHASAAATPRLGRRRERGG